MAMAAHDSCTALGDMLVEAPCGCYACTHEVQPGHEAMCQASSKWLVLAEAKGQAYRRFDRALKTWSWYRRQR